MSLYDKQEALPGVIADTTSRGESQEYRRRIARLAMVVAVLLGFLLVAIAALTLLLIKPAAPDISPHEFTPPSSSSLSPAQGGFAWEWWFFPLMGLLVVAQLFGRFEEQD